MKKAILAILLSITSISACAVEVPKWGKYSIKFPIDKSTPWSATFSYIGKNYNGAGQTLPLEQKKKETMDAEEGFMADIVRRNATGDRQKILELWHASERHAVEAAMDSSSALERNTSFFRNIEGTRLLVVMRYDAYYLFVVEHQVKGIGTYMKLYPATFASGSYLMTNALTGDFFYEKLAPNMMPYLKVSHREK
jgi:hypothetical protein